MDNAAIDGDYIHRNLGLGSNIHVVQDSDELMLVSWGPLDDRGVPLDAVSEQTTFLFGKWERGMWLHEALFGPVSDPLKRRIFSMPVYWHSRDILKDKWESIEKRALTIIKRYGLRETVFGRTTVFFVKLIRKGRRLRLLLIHFWEIRHRIMRSIIKDIE
jgi:hypothetical protein